MKYAIIGARILDDATPTNIEVTDGVITALGAEVAPDAEVIGAAGTVALPGLVDIHTHLREPGREDAETVLTGSRAAAKGGFTAVHAMANTNPVQDTAGAVIICQADLCGRDAAGRAVQKAGAQTGLQR